MAWMDTSPTATKSLTWLLRMARCHSWAIWRARSPAYRPEGSGLQVTANRTLPNLSQLTPKVW